MKKLITSLCMLAVAGASYGKAVDENTAQAVAYNFYKPKAALQGTGDLSLAYTATSVVNGATVVDFYVFNTVSVQGFVMVSGDDNVQPILAYSTESNFVTTNINPSVQYWLNNYKGQIAYVIQNNLNATSYVAGKWDDLESANPVSALGKITTVTVGPLLQTKWDQENYGSTLTYNADCPKVGNQHTVTGCVATAMSQVMKYWNWPDTGAVGTYVSYTQSPNPDGIGVQTVHFDSAYHFSNMTTNNGLITSSNTAQIPYVAKLMHDAGVSVYMDYGTDAEGGSGSYVTEGYSNNTHQCAEWAMVNYWRYPQSKGIQRGFSTYGSSHPNAWVDTMLNEMNASRPVIYAGSDTSGQGGHCWVMDGYDNDSFFHFNWGWSGSDNGNYTVNNLAPAQNGVPSGYVFNEGQEAIIHIIPDTPTHVNVGVAQVTSSVNDVKIFPNPATNTINISLAGATANEILISDIEGRTMQQFAPVKGQDIITLSVSNLPNGIYLVRLQTDQGIVTRKLVVAK